jgi:hypothetical protein
MPEPQSDYFSTHLNSRIDSIEKLATRNLRMLGCPLTKLEITMDTGYECIAKAVELYTQYTEPDTEFLLFDSELYTPGVGIKIDNLMSYTPELSSQYDPIDPNTVVGRDYDLQDWRKVIDVRNIEVGENNGANILFTVQHAMVQQMGALMHSGGLNKGFDLITWYAMNEFLELRNKMLSLKQFTRFDPNTQILRIFPEPSGTGRSMNQGFGKYWALVECYVEPRFRDCLKNHWIQEYSLALMKIAIGHVRGKYGGTQLFGGGVLEFQTMMNQGREDKARLEEQLLNGTGGFVGSAPPAFLVF